MSFFILFCCWMSSFFKRCLFEVLRMFGIDCDFDLSFFSLLDLFGLMGYTRLFLRISFDSRTTFKNLDSCLISFTFCRASIRCYRVMTSANIYWSWCSTISYTSQYLRTSSFYSSNFANPKLISLSIKSRLS